MWVPHVEGEAHFLLAELALTVAAADWDTATARLDRGRRDRARGASGSARLRARHASLPPVYSEGALDRYVRDALELAARA